MIKRQEIADASSCLNRAGDDEYVFVLLERDVATAETIRFWVRKRIEKGKNQKDDPQIVAALRAADRIEKSHRNGPVFYLNEPDATRTRCIEEFGRSRNRTPVITDHCAFTLQDDPAGYRLSLCRTDLGWVWGVFLDLPSTEGHQ